MTRQGEGSGPAGRCDRDASSMKRGVGARRGRMPLDPEDKALGRLKRALRKAERHAGDGSNIGGTGATILKFLPAPLARLVDKKRIGTEEIRAADEIAVAFRDATLANGDYSVIAVTTALSTTIPSGSALGTSNSTPFKLWLTAVNDAGTVSLAVINCYNTATNNIYPLSGDGVVTITAYGGGANSVAMFYGTAGHSNVPYSILGFATYETGSTLATAGTWSAGPSRQVLYRPGIALPGDTVQSLLTTNSAASTGSNNLTFNTSAPTAAAGNLVASQAITPKSSAHLARIEGQALIGTPSGTATADIGLWVTQDAGANALCTASTNTSRGTTSPVDVGLMFQQLANTLVSTTFKLYAALNGSLVVSINTVIGGSAFYGGTANSYILVEEIAT